MEDAAPSVGDPQLAADRSGRSGGSSRPSRSIRPKKRAGRLQSGAAIREAATTLFLSNGYLGTSMDEIAARAGVSKQTVYTHFADKERLFTELVLGNTERVDEFVDVMTDVLHDTDDLDEDLRELARTYQERVPERTIAALARMLERLAGRGLLTLEDPRLAAEHFVALILWIPLDRAMFVPDAEMHSPAELERFADAGVRVFLAAYRPG